jgi:hypothetical protein
MGQHVALRSHAHVVEAAGVRSSESAAEGRAWADCDSSKRASEPDAEPRPRVVDALLTTGSCPADPATPRRAVAVWPEEPGLTPAPTLLRRRDLLLHGHRAASPGAASLGAASLGAGARAAPPAPSLRSAACAALKQRCLCRDACAATPAPRRFTLRRRARRRLARLRLARLRLAPRRLAREAVCLRPAPPCEDITKCSLYTLVCVQGPYRRLTV